MNLKKSLLMFLILDFVFVGLVMMVSLRTHRGPATDGTESEVTADLSEGQKNKWALVETFRFRITSDSIEFSTDKLQIICDTASLIELRFSAQNIAIAGVNPSISHIYSCDAVKKDLSQQTLSTRISDFINIKNQKLIKLTGSELRASQIYSDEDFPSHWRLTDIKVSGLKNFTVNEFEIEKTLMKNFDFVITSAK